MSDYHSRIMNIPVGNPEAVPYDFKKGHQNARHAAADIANEADAEIESLRSRLAAVQTHWERSAAIYDRTEADLIVACRDRDDALTRLAAAEVNDRRYRWLREKPGRLANIHTEGLALWNERQDITGAEAVDDAIDAHLAAAREGEAT